MSENINIENWNYRLFEGKDGYLTIGEVYYNSEGNPIGWIEEAPTVGGSSVGEVLSELKLMMSAVDKPIFKIPEESENDSTRNG